MEKKLNGAGGAVRVTCRADDDVDDETDDGVNGVGSDDGEDGDDES